MKSDSRRLSQYLEQVQQLYGNYLYLEEAYKNTTSKEDLNLFMIKDSVNDAFDYLVKNMQK